MNTTSCTVIIPCYNESENIPQLLSELKQVVEATSLEFVLVDNGSTDNTKELLLSHRLERVGVLSLNTNAGYGGGILAGIQSANSKLVGWMHADLQTPPTELIRFDSLLGEYSFVKGRRNGRPLGDRMFTFFMSVVQLILWQRWASDINGQPTIVERGWMSSLSEPPTDFSLDLHVMLIAGQHGKKFEGVLVPFGTRHAGASKWNSGLRSRLNFAVRVARYSFKLRIDSFLK